jgi:hypothetical protein
MNILELLPCPFCGVVPLERFEKNPNGPKYPDHWIVWCENLDCKAGGEAMEETQEAARAAWNTRSPAPSVGVDVPNGYALVPLIPTPKMIEVGCENNPTMWTDETDDGFACTVANDIYVSMVRTASALVPSQKPSVGVDVRDALTAFTDFINEPPQYEDRRMVREYRHELAGKWSPLLDKLLAALTPSQKSGAGEIVGWRWRPRGAVNWIYDPTDEWREEHKDDDIEFQPLYAAPLPITDTVEGGQPVMRPERLGDQP